MVRSCSSLARLVGGLIALVVVASSCAGAEDPAIDTGTATGPAADQSAAIELVDPESAQPETTPEPVEPDPTPVPAATTSGDTGSGDTGEAGATTGDIDEQPADGPEGDEGPAAVVMPEVIETFPHDPDAFTQGFELVGDDVIFESTGLRGESSLRRVDLASGEVLQQIDVDDDLFAEGLTQVGNTLIQLTWTSGVSLWYDADSFELLRTVDYDGEGWGLCFDGDRLVMSDGSDELTFRDPETFDAMGAVSVTLDGEPVVRLNELECVNGSVYANIWQTPVIVEIDPTSGVVETIIDASSLVNQRIEGEGVLNGIAFDANSQNFLITGKNWNTVYRVEFTSTS